MRSKRWGMVEGRIWGISVGGRGGRLRIYVMLGPLRVQIQIRKTTIYLLALAENNLADLRVILLAHCRTRRWKLFVDRLWCNGAFRYSLFIIPQAYSTPSPASSQ